MDLLHDKIKTVYFKYLSAAFGSALVSSIYSIVDASMVGIYHGPEGTAALAVVAPFWNIIYSLGLLLGIGGSVIFSTKRGSGEKAEEANKYFTSSVLGAVIISIIVWATLILFEEHLLRFFGANEDLLALAKRYVRPIKYVFPLFLFNQLLSAFLRNDNNPRLATISVLSGGIFNVFGDYFFVFVCNMGIYGAGLATALGAAISFIIMLTHFLSRKNSLSLVKTEEPIKKIGEISVAGFSSFFIDIAMGILTILFNRQIMNYLGSNALAIYGVIIQVSTFVQCCAYSVGQASQPIISISYGAKNGKRIKETLSLALMTTLAFGVFWLVLSTIFPSLYIRIFMSPTPEILTLAPSIIRTYGLSFLLLPFNIFSTYYFQSIMRSKEASIVSVLRGIVISGILIMILPSILGANSIWFSMPLTELIVAFYAAFAIYKYTKALPTIKEQSPFLEQKI